MNVLIVQETADEDEFGGVEVWSTDSEDEEVRKPTHGKAYVAKEVGSAGKCLIVTASSLPPPPPVTSTPISTTQLPPPIISQTTTTMIPEPTVEVNVSDTGATTVTETPIIHKPLSPTHSTDSGATLGGENDEYDSTYFSPY